MSHNSIKIIELTQRKQKKELKLDKISLLTIISIGLGISLRFLSFLVLPSAPDTGSYVGALELIQTGTYNSFRPPLFPLAVLPFLLMIDDMFLAIKTASLIFGCILLIISYFTFSSLLPINGEEKSQMQNKSRIFGLVVTLSISVQYLLVYNNGRGLREEFLTIQLVLIFQFLFSKNSNNYTKNTYILCLLFSALVLTHLLVGLFTYLGFLFYFIIVKIRLKEGKISTLRFVIISLSTIISVLFWFGYCALHFNDPFYTVTYYNSWFKENYTLDISSMEGLISGLIDGLEIGVFLELQKLTYEIGFVFVILIIFTFFTHREKEEIWFLLFILLCNFGFLSVFFAVTPNPRLIITFYPFLFFLAWIPLINLIERRNNFVLRLNKLPKKRVIRPSEVFVIIYIFLYCLRMGLMIVYFIDGGDGYLNVANNLRFLCEVSLVQFFLIYLTSSIICE